MEAGTRSTSMGDVIVDPSGQPHWVEKSGFEKIESIQDDYERALKAAMDRSGDKGNERSR